MKYILRSLMFLLVSTALFSCRPADGILERNKKPIAQAYANFQLLNENYHSKHFEVSLLYQNTISGAASPNPIRVFKSVNRQFIMQGDAEKNDATQGNMDYFKIDAKGKIIGKLHLANSDFWPEFIDNFMVFTNYDEAYYTTWPLNGDTTKRTFKVLNADLKWTGDKINQLIKSVQKGGAYWFFKNVTDKDNYYQQFLFYQDKQWQLLWLKMPSYQSLESNQEANRYQEDVFMTGEEEPYLPENVDFLYFYPTEKVEYAHHIGGGSPGFSVTNWRGKAFFKTKIAGKNFEFFVPNIAVENEEFDGNRNRFYRITEANGSALAHHPSFYITEYGFAFYSSDSNKIYLISSTN